MLQEITNNEPTTSVPADSRSNCFGCSPDNQRGLHLQFQTNEDGEMIAEWIPDSGLEGYQGVIHGGIVSTVLDEAMAKVVSATGAQALTGELRVRFRRQVTTGRKVFVRGWIVRQHRLMLKAEAALTTSDGAEFAHAWAIFLPLK